MQTEQLTITGMTCGGCTNSVIKALKAFNGVNDVTDSVQIADEGTALPPCNRMQRAYSLGEA